MTLREAVELYIDWKRAQGARFVSQAYALRRFCRSVGNSVACDGVADDQVAAFLAGAAPASGNRVFLHCTLAAFYGHAIAHGIVTRSPLPAEGPKAPSSALPYIYSRDEMRRLLDSVKTFRKRINQLEPHTLRALLLLLYGTGLRRGEALNLTLADVDLRAAVLTIRNTKFGKTRLVPLGPQLARAMQDYAAQRGASGALQAKEAPFLVNRNGSPLAARTVSKAFHQLRQAAGVGRENEVQRQPRLHDMRHSFAVQRLIDWYRQGEDVQRMLPLLSTYLGHASVAGTQTYLRMTPELLHEAALRFERYVQSGAGGSHV